MSSLSNTSISTNYVPWPVWNRVINPRCTSWDHHTSCTDSTIYAPAPFM